MAIVVSPAASLVIWNGDELAVAISEFRRLAQFFKETASLHKTDEKAEGSHILATPFVHPSPAPASTQASVAGSLRSPLDPGDRARNAMTGILLEVDRLTALHLAAAQGDEHAARRCGAGDPELTLLTLQLRAVVHDCVGAGRIGISQDNFLQLETVLEQSSTRFSDFVRERRREEQAEEAELKDRLRSHEDRMKTKMMEMRDNWEKNAAADTFLNSADQRRQESELQSQNLIEQELQRRRDEVAREEEEEERKRVADVSGEQDQELRRRAEKLERLRQSEANRALRKGYSTNPDYRPPQEFRFGN